MVLLENITVGEAYVKTPRTFCIRVGASNGLLVEMWGYSRHMYLLQFDSHIIIPVLLFVTFENLLGNCLYANMECSAII